MKTRKLVSILVGLCSLASLQAGLLIQESFEYTPGSAIRAAKGGTGFNGPWKDTTGSMGEANVWWENMPFDGLQTAGSALILDFSENVGNKTLSISREISAAPAADEPVWVSMLCRFETEESNLVYLNATVFMRIVSHKDRSIKYRMGITDKQATILHAGGAAATGKTKPLAITPEKTYLLVAYFPPLEGQNKDESRLCRLWVFDKALPEFAAEPTERELNRNAIARATAPGAAETIEAGDILFVGLWGRGNTIFSTLIDEIRYGTSAADVLPRQP